jgi:uncharacterized heparinase superfamily protein
MTRVLLYARTLRHLRPSQIAHRILRQLPKPATSVRPAPPLRAVQRAPAAYAPRSPKLLAANEIELLNLRGRIDDPAIWRAADKPMLWLYQLHYFDDLNGDHPARRRDWHRAWIDRWIAENPPGSAVAWDSYPVSLRVVNWIKWQLAGEQLPPQAIESLAHQVRHLSPRLEKHLEGNHLLENYKALAIAGCFFTGAEADAWRAQGLRGLERELARQVLADGAYSELAPMYHGIVSEGLLDLTNILQTYGLEQPAWLIDVARRMTAWGAGVAHPDGDWPQFNDTSLGSAPRPAELAAYLQRLGLHSGNVIPGHFVRISLGDWVLVADLADLGPDHNPGHGHADSLTYELSIAGRRVVVDTGISTYDVGETRASERATAAHNTLAIDGENSSEVWGSFRVARRARTQRIATPALDGALTIAAEHDGYRRLKGAPRHRRGWVLGKDSLVIRDDILSRSAHDIRSYIHLHPDYNAAAAADVDSVAIVDSGRNVVARISRGSWKKMSVTDYCYAPRFGVRIAAKCIVLEAESQGDSSFSHSIAGT